VEAFAVALREVFGREMDAVAIFRASNGRTIGEVADDVAGSDPVRAAALVRVYRDIYYDASRARALDPFPGIAETLAALRVAGIRVAVVTSKLRAGAEGELRRASLLDLVEFVVGAEDAARPKPAPDPVLLALGRFGMAPAAGLMVGDTTADVLAAQSAGASSGAALWGTQDRPALLGHTPTYLFEDPRDVLAQVGA
jgi:AHBA synthesis associated protein